MLGFGSITLGFKQSCPDDPVMSCLTRDAGLNPVECLCKTFLLKADF